MLTAQQHKDIDQIKTMSYKDMLISHRRLPFGHHYHTGEVGAFFHSRMTILGDKLTEQERLNISARVGW